MASRIFIAIAAALIIGCGSGSSSEEAPVPAGHQHSLVTPPCVGPGCSAPNPGVAPPAPPFIATKPLGPVDPPPLPLPLPAPGVALKRSSSSSLRLAATPGASAATTPPPGCINWSVGMQVLVISTDGKEADLGAIQQALGFHTIQYTTWIATQTPGALTADKLATGCAGNYQGVILTTGALAYSPDGGVTWKSALSSTEWMTLRTYEANFHVREISWYVYPGADQGLNPPSSGMDTTTTPINMTLTAAGQTVFPYVNASNPIPIQNAWTYQATASDPNVTVLAVDSGNHALVSKRLTSDGRETLAMTFDSNPYLIHDLVLQHGLIEWVTKGAYLGEFRSYLQPQVDDLFIDDDMYNASAYAGGVFRISSDDFNKSHNWWMAQQAQPGNADFRVLLAFNGEGSDLAGANDPLTLAVKDSWGDYFFCNHTYTHANLDPPVDYNTAYAEINNNNQFALSLGIPDYSTQSLVTPDVSGLTNPAALSAAFDNGIRFMISDTSKESGKGTPGWNNPAPNIGIYSTIQPMILFAPRHPTNLFYNVSTPDEWTAEYNAIYATFWGRNLTYQEILDKESQNLLVYMLQGDLDPHMYHQTNLRAYDGTHSLFGDLLDMAFAKFRRYSTLPIKSLRLEDIGSRMADTMGRNWSGVTGAIVNGTSARFTTPNEVWFNASGVCNLTAERYAGRCISSLYLPAGGTLTLPVQ
ncbi:MAG: hypothetical protein E6J78_10200 [Deltaproteobacteria bacterium]|nr:MAG: hypothetical protein E6J78_10200 [Deltaproteobacteria bacterium]